MKPGQFDVCITTTEGLNICLPTLKKYKWVYMIFDEAHKLKNTESKIAGSSRIL
jgi:SNF2 family DNA or RNA helicase